METNDGNDAENPATTEKSKPRKKAEASVTHVSPPGWCCFGNFDTEWTTPLTRHDPRILQATKTSTPSGFHEFALCNLSPIIQLDRGSKLFRQSSSKSAIKEKKASEDITRRRLQFPSILDSIRKQLVPSPKSLWQLPRSGTESRALFDIISPGLFSKTGLSPLSTEKPPVMHPLSASLLNCVDQPSPIFGDSVIESYYLNRSEREAKRRTGSITGVTRSNSQALQYESPQAETVSWKCEVFDEGGARNKDMNVHATSIAKTAPSTDSTQDLRFVTCSSIATPRNRRVAKLSSSIRTWSHVYSPNLDLGIDVKITPTEHSPNEFTNNDDRSVHSTGKVIVQSSRRTKISTPAAVSNSYGEALSSPEIKMCRCKRSKCLKLYCDCFAASTFCDPLQCKCLGCKNLEPYLKERKIAMDGIKARNASAFECKRLSKAEKRAAMLSPDESATRRTCHCRKSACLKKYCECFFTKVFCCNACRCIECENHLGSVKLQKVITP